MIQEILKTRKDFSAILHKHMKDFSDEKSIFFNLEYSELLTEFKEEHQTFLLEQEDYQDEISEITKKINDLDNTKKDYSDSSINMAELNKIYNSLSKKAHNLKDRQNNYAIAYISLANKRISEIDKTLNNIFIEKFPISNNYFKQFKLLDDEFPPLLQYCSKWESKKIFEYTTICKDIKFILNIIQKSNKLIYKLKTTESFFETKEYKTLSEYCQTISSLIDNFNKDEIFWNNFNQLVGEYPQIKSFKDMFQKNDFTSVKSKIRIISSIDKTEITLKEIRKECRLLEQLFEFKLFQLNKQKEEILNLCLKPRDFQAYIIKNWLKKELKDEIKQITHLNDIYHQNLWDYSK